MKTVTRIPLGVEIVSGDPTAPNGFRRRLNVLVEFKNMHFGPLKNQDMFAKITNSS